MPVILLPGSFADNTPEQVLYEALQEAEETAADSRRTALKFSESASKHEAIAAAHRTALEALLALANPTT